MLKKKFRLKLGEREKKNRLEGLTTRDEAERGTWKQIGRTGITVKVRKRSLAII